MSSALVLVIGDKNLSSWSLRPWLVLRQAEVPFEEHVFAFEQEDWREKIAELSPSRRVPVLRHRGAGAGGEDLLVWDSLAIAEYVAELHPDKRLWPEDRDARAVARAVSAEMHSGFASLRREMPMNVTARVPTTTPSRETQADIERIQAIWKECRDRFGAGGPFLFGAFSIADAMFAPVVWRFRTHGVPVNDPAARAWFEAMLELPAMKEWEADAEREVRAQRERPKRSTPDPTSAQEYWAVIFTSQYATGAKPPAGYEETAAAMVELAKKQPGFLGIESARGPDGFGITISYWDSREAIALWKAQADHRAAQRRGREEFYARYEIRVASVERGYKHPR